MRIVRHRFSGNKVHTKKIIHDSEMIYKSTSGKSEGDPFQKTLELMPPRSFEMAEYYTIHVTIDELRKELKKCGFEIKEVP